MAVGQIISRAIATGAIGADQIATGAITAADIPAGEITADKLHTTLDLSSKTVTMPQASITAHQAALSITESQVSDLRSYVLPNTSPTFTNTTLTGYLAGPATFTIDPAGVGDNTGTVVIAGNLQVDGTTTTINSTTLTVDDLNITLADGAADAAAANGAGITVAGANATITYDASNDEWDFNKDVNVTGNVYSSGYVGVGTTTAYSSSTDFEVKATNPKMVFNNTGIRAFGLRVTGTNFQIRDESDNETWLTITHTGNVGIGTTTPSTTNGGYDGGTLHVHNTSTGSSIRLTNSTTGTSGEVGMLISKWSDSKTYFTNFDDGADMVFTPTDSSGNLVANTFVIKGDGKIGFGTSSPTATLQVGNAVSGQTGNVIINSEGGNPVGLKVASRVNRARIQVADNDTSGFIIAEGSIFSFGFADQASNNNLNITNSHNVGIGTTAPAHKLEVVGTTKADQYLLDAIAKDISDTASDVFIYDTRKDSDGGAWRKRTQHTSWYNETLNTSKRGSRKEFPAVAVLAFNTNQELWIYDGDDPNLSLWAKYTTFTQDSGDTASITAVNGSIYAGQAHATYNYSGNGYFQLNFAADYFFSNIVGTFGSYLQGRADGLLTSYDYRSRGDRTTAKYTVPNLKVNDIAVTVLPDAPIDSDTGLPTPTIALATNGGVSVIKDDGTVVDITESSNSTNITANVEFLDNGQLVFRADGNTDFKWVGRVNLPAGDINYSYQDESKMPYVMYSGGAGTARLMLTPPYSSDASTATTAFTSYKDNVIAGTIKGFGQGTTDLTTDNTYNGNLVNYTSSSYNTGWMNGDIKLATLSDTDTTNASSSDLNTDPNFDSGVGIFIAASGTVTHSSGTITSTKNSGGSSAMTSSAVLTIGKTYYIEFEITATSPGYTHINSPIGEITSGQVGTHSGFFVATDTTINFGQNNGGSTSSVTFTRISISLAEADRSVNGNGLQVFGTVTKTAVATGADVAAYGGFSTSNYLRQPYNSDLDFGTGDFSVMLWFNTPNKSVAGTLLHRGSNEIGDGSWATNAVTQIEFNTSNLYALVGTNNFGINTGPNVPLTSISNNTWHHYVMVRRGGRIYAYLDGNYMDQAANILTNTNSTAKLYIGERPVASRVFNGSLALYRISATAPSEDQIKKIYNDEKHLFLDNAKATLYGSSDAVTALAYDDDTELLHVGTSAGRSVFQGLRRIDNTTDAVGAAISASNGMVAED
jgi:hypothetical protein